MFSTTQFAAKAALAFSHGPDRPLGLRSHKPKGDEFSEIAAVK